MIKARYWNETLWEIHITHAVSGLFKIHRRKRIDQIIAINFEDLEYEELCEYKVLYDYLKERLLSDKTTYIFLDEIQKVPQFEKVVDSLYIKSDTDIYITGSNAYMLSGELATLLSGRYVEISMLPFSFQEYCQLNRKPQEDAFADYMKFGGLPLVASMKDAPG